MPKTITVSNSDELYDAMASSKGGETILLEGGNYGKLWLTPKTDFDFDYPSTVTIASKDPDDPAVFTGADVRSAENLAFEGIKFDYTFKAGDTIGTRPFYFEECEGLTIRDSTFDGDNATSGPAPAVGYGAATGLSVRWSSDVVIEGNEIKGFQRGSYMDSNTNTVVRDNNVHSMRMDGMTFSNMDDVTIEENYIHDFRGSPTSGDHSDFIQFWTSNTSSPSTNVTIRDNVLDIGNGTATQSIFMRNEQVDMGKDGKEMYYQDILIENNTITNAHKNAINVAETAGLTIRNNTVLHADGGKADGGDSSVEIPAITVKSVSTGVTITDNLVTDMSGVPKNAAWNVAGNVVVQDQDPFGKNYYSDVFVSSTLQPTNGKHEFQALPGGIVDTTGVGSDRTQTAPAGLNPTFHVEQADIATRVFDASVSTLNGKDLPAGTTYSWSFGDGTTAKGAVVSHSFAKSGSYDVKLTTTLPDGKSSTEALTVKVQSAEVVSLSEDGRFVAYQDGVEVPLSDLAKYSDSGLQLGAKGVAASVGRSYVADVVGADDMSIAFSIDADSKGASGELFRLPGSFTVSVTSSGEVQLRLFQQDGKEVWATTKGAGVADGNDHDVVMQLADDRLQLWVDGDKLADVAATGVVGGATGYGSHGLSFGNPWGQANFNGDLTAFEIAVGADDFPPRPTTTVLSAAPKAATAAPAAMTVTATADEEEVAPFDQQEDDRFEFSGAADLDAFAA